MFGTFLLFISPGCALAQDVLVRVQQRGDPAALQYVLHTAAATSEPRNGPVGKPLPSTGDYALRDYKVVRTSTGSALGAAMEILAQSRVGSFDVVLARQEYDSFSTPWRWLAALSGHPVQVNRITWFLVATDGIVRSGYLVARPNAYYWSVRLFEPPRTSP
ncbi:MAG TPA: hypothetical protein VG167_01940 [Verrucomicrobiae bacterium]|nr:hypothetical protein [Verrucomicrobiae bacterium]